MILRNFNRRFTVRRLEQFGNPVSAPLADLELPRNSTLHFISGDKTEFGPSQTLPYLANTEKGALINHHLEYDPTNIIGRPRKATVSINKDLILYHRINKRIRKLRDPKIIERDSRILYIENYAPLVQTYIYTTTLMSWYERWYNVYHTAIAQIAKDAKESDRQNYLVVKVPETIPSIMELNRAQSRRDNVTLKDMRNDNVLFFLELWTWLGEKRESSLLNLIAEDTLRRVNIVVTYRDRFINLNLGELNFWRKNIEGQGRVKPIQMQRRLYKSYVDIATRENDYQGDATDTEFTMAQKTAPLDESLSRDEQMDFVLGLNQDTEENDSVEDIDAQIKNFDSEVNFDEDTPIEIIKRDADDKEKELDIYEPVSLQQGVLKACDKYIDAGVMTSKEYNRIVERSDAFRSLPNPLGHGTIGDMLVITKDELKIKPIKMIENDPTLEIDPTLTQSSIVDFDKKYINDILPKDVIGAVTSMQKGGVLLNDYSTDTIVDATGKSTIHTLKVQPVGGEPSTLRFTLPVLDDRGYWTANDIKYTLRKQRVDVPIRKTAINTVALTSAYGKNFIRRSDKAVADYPGWLQNQIIAIGSDRQNLNITDVNITNVFDPSIPLPKDYTTIAQRISSFIAGNVVYSFDVNRIEQNFNQALPDGNKDKMVPVGKSVDGTYYMDYGNTIYRKESDKMVQLGNITEVLEIDTTKAPREYTELSMMGRAIPLAVIFGYYLGFEGLLKQFKIPYRMVEPSERVGKDSSDFVVPMVNAKAVISYDSIEQMLLVQGFKPYLKIIQGFTQADMNSPDVYLNLIAKDGLNARYLNELTLMDELFIDPITERLLVQMREPTTFKGLLARANEMLAYDSHKDEVDLDEMHLFGAQRMAMAVYTEVVRSIRDYRNRPGMRKKLEMHSNAVFQAIQSDPSVLLAQGANPIQPIREADVVTFGGTGGRSKRSMVKRTRKFTDSDIGVVSGDTVDSGDVASTAYLTADPILESLDGVKDPTINRKELSVNQIMSSAAALAPGCLYDDDKRINFVGIQHGSGTFAKGYTTTGFRTGYEKVIAHRTSPEHATIADYDGKVVAVDDAGITIEYATKPPSTKSYPIGRTFGRHEGGNFPHDITTKHKVGDVIKARDIITYNEHFFEPDIFNPNQVNWKAGVMANVAFLEGVDTWEDSSAIDEWLSDQLSTEVTKVKNITINFDQTVHGLVKNGEHLNPDSILCTIEDALTANVAGFTSSSLATLANLSAHTPRAGLVGYVDKIEVFYNGEYEDMSESVLAIAKAGDRQRTKEAKASPVAVASNGKVDSTLRIEGNPVELDTLVVRIYISHETGTIGGDKGVFANQLKTTFRRIMTGRNETENGDKVNALFGRVAVDNRIVLSVYQICTTNKICQLASDHCLKILNEEL